MRGETKNMCLRRATMRGYEHYRRHAQKRVECSQGFAQRIIISVFASATTTNAQTRRSWSQSRMRREKRQVVDMEPEAAESGGPRAAGALPRVFFFSNETI